MDIDREAILRTFLAESEEHLGAMEEALVALEAQPEDEGLLQLIFRVAHTLKGSSDSLGFPWIADFAHTLEDHLARIRERTIPITGGVVTLLLQAVDALRQMVPAAVAGLEELQPAHAELLRRLAAGTPAAPGEASSPSSAAADRRTSPFGRRQEDIQVRSDRTHSIRVDIQKLDRMLNLAGEIAIGLGRLRQVLEAQARREGEEGLEAQGVVDALWMELQEQILKVRMVPVGPTFRQYIRTVRDLSQANGKLARLAIQGEDVEVDTTVVEHLKDPLTHMIRNAVDHGIEPPEVRRAKGKDPCGRVTLRASHEAGSIVIQVADDGAGLDRQRILQRARAVGMLGDPDTVPEEDLDRLIFEPGFSTAEAVTDLSGRGVGMDVVRRNIDALRGSVGVTSRPGEGTTVTMRLPLTLSIIEGLGVGVGEETYVLPLDRVLECLELPAEERHPERGQGVINLRGQALPFLRLRDQFALPGPPPPRENIVVVQHEARLLGLAVDRLYGTSQTVIKPLGDLFKTLPGIAGSAILGNGRVALILDVPGIVQQRVDQEEAFVAARR
jgi:two-component system chemotaxis sensor kinase CheA